MNINELLIVIPAVKKNVAFPDDLIKKLNNKLLIEYAFENAKKITRNVLTITDSQEITLICEKHEVNFLYDPKIKLKNNSLINAISPFFEKILNNEKFIMILSPYTPLIKENLLKKAFYEFKKEEIDILISAKRINHNIFDKRIFVIEKKSNNLNKHIVVDVSGFAFIKKESLNKNYFVTKYFLLPDECLEINSYTDWWICEKLLNRKRIVFNVIGNDRVGMGHIYRALTIAHEISEHEIIFVTTKENSIAVNKIAGSDYLIEVSTRRGLIEKIISMSPDLVINDCLNTTLNFIKRLKEHNIKVVNFEDLGKGCLLADMVINEIYDKDIVHKRWLAELKNIKWGYEYYFLREEFNYVKPHFFAKKISNILLTFGGTDENNLTQYILSTIWDICKENNIKIYIICGPGYPHKDSIKHFIKKINYDNIELIFSTGIMAKIMELCDIGISSNGRTVFELAHMNIPSIIISQNEREKKHFFANEYNGFINLGKIERNKNFENKIRNVFKTLINNNSYREKLFKRIKKFDFSKNKDKIVNLILDLISDR